MVKNNINFANTVTLIIFSSSIELITVTKPALVYQVSILHFLLPSLLLIIVSKQIFETDTQIILLN